MPGRKDDGYDDIRQAYLAGVAAAVSCALGNGEPRKAPDVEAYITRLKLKPLVAKLFE